MKNIVNSSSLIPTWWEYVRVLDMPIILLGPDAKILGVNQSVLEKLGFSEKELRCQSVLDIIHRDDRVKEVNNYINILYSSTSVSKSRVRLKIDGGKYLSATQILHAIKEQENNDRFALLTFQEENNNSYASNWGDAQNLIDNINSLTNMFDLGEFSSTYNRNVINQIKVKLSEFIDLVSKSKVA